MNLRTRLFAAALTSATLAGCTPASTVGSPSTTATPASAPTATRAPAMPAGVTDATIAEGKALFELPANNCSRCHGTDGKGTTRGPNLTDSVWVHNDGTPTGIAKTITEGVPAAQIKNPNFQFPMAAKGRAALTDAQVSSIAAYLWSVSHKH
jgi:mono/diheme cytochrome c family protein